MINLYRLIACLFGISFGLLLLILGCALWNVWWSLFAIALYFMAPIPDLVGKIISNVRGKGIDELFDETPTIPMVEHMGSFFTAFLATLGVGINFILFHANAIGLGTFLFEIFGGLVIGLSIIFGLAMFRIITFREKSVLDI